ncbi:hypothetical protein T484DRAFT_3031856 [Baffinella frigidus]|nr:hypothetical protein T484DRAFT_3031856 [Cryptophyta sp. CCMP2293]
MTVSCLSGTQRVEKPLLWALYQEHKKEVGRRQAPNEKLLFHGTSKAVARKIVAKNFKRSYGTSMAFGDGLYFARSGDTTPCRMTGVTLHSHVHPCVSSARNLLRKVPAHSSLAMVFVSDLHVAARLLSTCPLVWRSATESTSPGSHRV